MSFAWEFILSLPECPATARIQYSLTSNSNRGIRTIFLNQLCIYFTYFFRNLSAFGAIIFKIAHVNNIIKILNNPLSQHIVTKANQIFGNFAAKNSGQFPHRHCCLRETPGDHFHPETNQTHSCPTHLSIICFLIGGEKSGL